MEKQLATAGKAQKFAGENVRLDHAAASGNIIVLWIDGEKSRAVFLGGSLSTMAE